MSPPTEQLIRDYLNRLSVAARGRLGSPDRQALVIRTRDFIERNASQIGQANPMQVAALLSRLGDPGALVDQEVARLAAVRGETVTAPASRGGRLTGPLHRRAATASWHWPRPAGSPDLQIRLLNGAGTGSDNGAASPQPLVPQQYQGNEVVASEAATPADVSATPEQSDGVTADRPVWPSAVARKAATPSEQAGQAPTPGTAYRRDSAVAVLASALLSRAKEHKLEAVAVTLLGVGGAAYPPVWLLGAAAALASKVWDYRDKWIGLAGPVLLLVIGTFAGVSLGRHQAALSSYVHEGWIYIDVLSRVGALLGACYLIWRLSKARSAPKPVPWNRPHKIN